MKPFNAEKLMKETIAYCEITCGVTKVADPITSGNLRVYFFSELKNYTFEEVKRAVYFNSIGEYPERINTWDLFDVSFLSKVMTEWLILKNQTRNRVAALLPKPKEAEPETPETLYQGLLNYINKNNSFPEFWAWNDVYQHMDENDLIPQTNAEKTELFKEIEAKFRVKMELDLMEIRDFIERDALKSGHTERVKAECRKLTIQQNLSYLLNHQPHTKQPNCNETSNRDSNG